MRVCRVATVPFFLVHHLGGQIRATAEAGHDVLLISSPGPGWDRLRAIPGVRAIEIPIARPIAPIADLRALFALWRCLRANRVEVLHSTTPKAGLLAALAGALARVPVRMHTFTGQAWAELTGPARWIARLADRLIVALNTRCYADSRSQRDFLVAQGIGTADEITVLGAGSLAGVDVDALDPARHADAGRALRATLGIAPADRVIAFIGRLTRDKGVGELVEAFERLGAGVHLILVGPEEPERDPLPDRIRARIDAHPHIHACGYQPDPARYLAAADLLCLPSYREGFGNVVIEAAAMGRPTVGTRIVGLSDAIEEARTGLLVPPKDVDALASALGSLLRDDALRLSLGRAARERAQRLFGAESVNRRVLEEYAALAMRDRS